MTLNYLLAVDTDATNWTFDRQQVVDALLGRWADAEVVDDPVPGSQAGVSVYLPRQEHREPEVTWYNGGGGISLELHDRQVAAEVISVLSGLPDFPEAGVLLTDWADTVVSVRPAMTAAALLALGEDS